MLLSHAKNALLLFNFKCFNRYLHLNCIYCAIVILVLINYCCVRDVIANNSFRPHIVFIMADDLGWNDVSFHGSDQILTPNIDALAFNGIILNNLYTQPVCTPSRASLMTGKYPIHVGMQGRPLLAAEPVGLPLSEKTLANYFKELGYTTRAVGKWHLGFYRREYTPRFRGFQSFFGYYGGFISYYEHLLQDSYANIGDFVGYDLHRDEQPAWQESLGEYATDLFTKEAVEIIKDHDADEAPLFLYVAHLAVHAGNTASLLEAPQEEVKKFRHIMDPNRRTYAAMVSKLDESLGEIIEALENKDMLKNTIVVFMSDNGAPSSTTGTPSLSNFPNWGSNFPFRGNKGTLWEGGVRSCSFIWSAALQPYSRVSNDLMHVSDWLPTLYSAAGGNPSNLPATVDGIDQWLTLSLNLPSKARRSVLINIDERTRNAATRVENWKLILTGVNDDAMGGYYGNYWDIFDGYGQIYNISAVIESKSGRAVKNVANSLFVTWANENAIRMKRRQSTVRCGRSWNLPGVYVNNNEIGGWQTTVSGTAVTNSSSCRGTPCLFNLEMDPCETTNLASQYPTIASQLYDILKFYRTTLVPQITQPPDATRANPKLWNRAWSSWIT